MTVYREPPKSNSRRSVGNLDGTSNGIGGTDTVRIQSGSGDFLSAAPTVKDNSYSSAKSGALDIKMQNVGVGSGVYARKERDGVTFSFRRLAAGDGMSINEVGDTIYLASQSGGVDRFVSLKDVPNSFTGMDGKTLVVDEANSRLIFQDFPVPVTSFLDLTDTPDSYGGSNGKFLAINSATGKIEFQSIVFPEMPEIPPQGARITFAEVPPVDPQPMQGDGWWNTTDGTFFLFYTDGDSGQWIESGASEPATAVQDKYAYDYGAYYDGQPGSSEVVYRWRAPRAHTLDANFAGCLFTCGVKPSNDFACDVWINGEKVGVWTINPAGASTMVSTGSGSIDVPANQEIKIVAPAQTDATLADLVISFKGERY